MNYLEDDTIPGPLWAALVDSSKEYGDEVKDFMSGKNYFHATSVTALNKPSQASVLEKRHSHEMWVDPVKDLWHSLLGNIVHFVLEKYAAKDPSYISEFRLGTEITVDGKKCYIHGKFDLYNKDTFTLQDWKLTSAQNMLYPKTHYELQLNILRYIMIKNGYKVKHLEDIYLFPHLDKTKMNNPNYPKRNVLPVKVEIMDLADVEKHIKERMSVQLTEKDKPDKELTPCTDEERWIRDSFWGLYTRLKSGPVENDGKRRFSSRLATRGDSKSEMIKWRKANGHKKEDVLYKEFKGLPKYCSYCRAAPFCRQQLATQLERDKQERDNQNG